MSVAKRMGKLGFIVALLAFVCLGCSWDIPVWSKSRRSDTPLFRFVVKEKDGAGYIDRDGNIVIPPTLSYFGNYGDDDFFDGLARVTMHGEVWYINVRGEPTFRALGGSFSEGLVEATVDGKAGFLNREGKRAIPFAFDSTGRFSEGLASAEVKGLIGYIGKDGRFTIKPKYLLAEPFSDGAARVIERGECLFIGYDPCGWFNPTILPHGSHSRSQLSQAPRCRYSFIDKKGQQLFEAEYPDAKDFSDGLAPVGDGKRWGYIDKRGTIAIPLRFDSAEPFSEGLARVRLGRKWGYIDKSGRIVIAATFVAAHDFSEGMAVVGDGAYRAWFIDNTGRQAIAQTFTGASNFVMGRAHVRNGVDYTKARWSYIDRTGRAIFTYSAQPMP